MAKKKLQSGLVLEGIAPNILLQHIENTAPFIFKGEIDTTPKNRQYLAKLRFYKKNLKQLNHLSLSDYFYLCMSAHFGTAGTFVPTDVDNQIRQGLWLHPKIHKNLEKMVDITIESLAWDYTPVSKRVCYNQAGETILSTHEGTWFSVAIGAYCACITHHKNELAQKVKESILREIESEINILIKLKEDQDHINFIMACPLIAHNFGDLDRVIRAWDFLDKDDFCRSIYRLGHDVETDYSNILVFAGEINKEMTSNENHRHMSLRSPKSLRKSNQFLIHVGPFLDDWGIIIGQTTKLSLADKAEIIVALFEGSKREKDDKGYARALGQILKNVEGGLDSFQEFLPFDLIQNLLKTDFYKYSQLSRDEFENSYKLKLEEFESKLTEFKFLN